jgi:hypothetical protein
MRLLQNICSGSGTLARAVGPTDAMYMEYSANDKPRNRLLEICRPGSLPACYLRCVGNVELRYDPEMKRHNRHSQGRRRAVGHQQQEIIYVVFKLRTSRQLKDSGIKL